MKMIAARRHINVKPNIQSNMELYLEAFVVTQSQITSAPFVAH